MGPMRACSTTSCTEFSACRRNGADPRLLVASSPERVPGHSCFRNGETGAQQHEIGATVAVGRMRRNVRVRYPAFHAHH